MKVYVLIFFLVSLAFCQDDLFDLIDDEPDKIEYIEYAFKGTRVANAQSLEIPKPKVLQFMIQHRFGSIENGFYDLFGTDYAIIRYDFSYGLNDVFAFGLGRSSFNKIYDIFLKAKLLRQSKGKKNMPFSVVMYSDLGIKTSPKSEQNPAYKDNFSKDPFGQLFVNGHYKNQTIVDKNGCLYCLGIYGQCVYINPKFETVIVKLSSQPSPAIPKLLIESVIAMNKIASSA